MEEQRLHRVSESFYRRSPKNRKSKRNLKSDLNEQINLFFTSSKSGLHFCYQYYKTSKISDFYDLKLFNGEDAGKKELY